MASKRRLWITLAAVAGVLILLLVIAIPMLLNADNYRGRVETMLSDATGRRVTLGHLSFSLFSGALVADNLTIADDPAFSQQPFVQAQSIHIGIDTSALLFHKQLIVHGITIDAPKINLIQNQANVWNYASLGNANKRKTSATTQSAMPNFSIGQIAVNNGQVSITDLGESTRPEVISSVNAKITNFSMTAAFPFTLSAALQGDGTVSVDGQAGPFNQADASKTPVNAKIQAKHMDLLASGFVPASAGVAGIVDVDATVNSNGQTAHAQGTITANQLKLAANGVPASKPVNINFAVDQNVTALTGQLQKTTVSFDRAVFNLAGSYQTHGAQTTLNMTAGTQGAPINDIQAFLPALGIEMPSGSRLQGGALTTSLAITGTTASPVIAGPVRLDNTQLAGFDLGSKLAAVTRLTGGQTGNNTTIRVLSLNLREANSAISAQNIVLEVPGLGTATGAGTVSAAKALNFHVVAKLAQTGATGLATQAISMIGGGIGGAAAGYLKNGVPVNITGTASNPVITPDLSGLTGSGAGAGKNAAQQLLGKHGIQVPNGNNLGKTLGGLFKH